MTRKERRDAHCTKERTSGAAVLPNKLGGTGETARELAYRLDSICERKKWADSPAIAWPKLTRLALAERTARPESQGELFRRPLNLPLARLGVMLQKQAFDHVLRDDERQEAAFTAVADDLARNPERVGLVPLDGFREYEYTGCLVPGYPDLSPWQADYWDRVWRLYSRLSQHGLMVTDVEETQPEQNPRGS